MDKREEIRKELGEILFEDLITCGFTHENPPPHKDCSEECGVSLDDQIAASNPIMSPLRSGGKKHKKCMDCWNGYIKDLVNRLVTKQDSMGVVIKVDRELPETPASVKDRFIKLYTDKGLISGDPRSILGLMSLVEQRLVCDMLTAGFEATDRLIKE